MLLPPLQPRPQITPEATPTSSRYLPPSARAYLCEGLCLVQHGLGSGLEGPGSLGDHALFGCDHLLHGLHLQAQVTGPELLRLQGDGGLRQGTAGRSVGRILCWVRGPRGTDGGEMGR